MQRTLVTADNASEMLPEVDSEGRVIGKMSRAEAHCGTKRLHPVVHLHLFNSQGELYLQHRATWKQVQPDKWDTATGGHLGYGETPEQALRREVLEEIGLRPDQYRPRLLHRYTYESATERELVYVYTATFNGTPLPSLTETQGGRFWTIEELAATIGKGVLTPMFEQELIKMMGTADGDGIANKIDRCIWERC